MKNEIKHPLERYKRIADPTIRQQCIENFDEEFYREYKYLDTGSQQDALLHGFNWYLAEDVQDTPGKTYAYFTGVYAMLSKESQSEIDQLRTENEKLRECLYDILESMLIAGTEKEEEIKTLLNK